MSPCTHTFRKTKNLKVYCTAYYSMPVQYYREYRCAVCGAADWRRDKMYRPKQREDR